MSARAWSVSGIFRPTKSLLYVGIAAVAALVIGTALWMREPTWKVLFSNVSDKGRRANHHCLAADERSLRVVVRGHHRRACRKRSTKPGSSAGYAGLPKASGVGFELMDNQISQFAEQVNYQRSIEGELARTIQALSAVGQRACIWPFPRTAYSCASSKTHPPRWCSTSIPAG